MHDYVPDFIIRLKTEPPIRLTLETKAYDRLKYRAMLCEAFQPFEAFARPASAARASGAR